MKILSIETSCDETAVSIIEATGTSGNIKFKILGDSLISQIDMHQEFGGVYPSVAKREHAKNLIPLLINTLHQANLYKKSPQGPPLEKVGGILEREPELLKQFKDFAENTEKPEIDAIAVTNGPGLEPALWIGINVAQALSIIWDTPVMPINHMEGHIISSLIKDERIEDVSYPALALLISGGHTELVLIKKWLSYEVIGKTRDDAVGEAFDKVARMLGLSYPGGPEISKLAKLARKNNEKLEESLPRPMIHSDDYDFSFSGLKTAVLYLLKRINGLSEYVKRTVSREFEDAVTEVLTSKVKKALKEYNVKTLIVGGGVAANDEIRRSLNELVKNEFSDVVLYTPDKNLSTDNAVMIAAVGYIHLSSGEKGSIGTDIKADGNLSL